jgi:5-methylcytosine-specific restriction endonuclease McrA
MSDNLNENVYTIETSDSFVYRERYCNYRSNANRSGREFNLTESTFVNIVKGDCHYCGQAAESKQFKRSSTRGRVLHGNPIKFQGIDRVDNDIGYTEENSVPCCSKCNFMKHTLNASDFIDHVLKIAEHIKNN